MHTGTHDVVGTDPKDQVEPQLIKLHRSKNHRMIAGVMGGVAEYYGWSPTALRVLFVVVSLASAAVPGSLIYLLLWLIMPNAKPSSYRS